MSPDDDERGELDRLGEAEHEVVLCIAAFVVALILAILFR
jgi:hypothetical protein